MIMSIDVAKDLEKLNIFPKEKIEYDQKISVARDVTDMLSENVHELSESYNEISMRLLNCDMYFADIDAKYGNVIYYYKNNSLYLHPMPLEEIPREQLVHECIHYLQNFSNVMKSNQRAGLSNFDEFKIIGLGLNEAMTQYITATAMEKKIKRVENENISIVTNSSEYYKYMTSLAHQIVFLMGRKSAIRSAIESNGRFEDDLYNTFEENTNRILKNFDLLLEEYNQETKDENKMIDIYLQTQELIYKTYFTKTCKVLTTRNEVDQMVQKIYDYEEIYGRASEETEKNAKIKYNQNFDEFTKEMDDKFYQKYIEIDRKIAKNLPKKYQVSFWDKVVEKIKSFWQFKERKAE